MISAIEDIAQKAGIDPARVKVLKKDHVSRLVQRGFILDLHIGYFRATSKLKADDLGIELTEKEQEWVSLGHQKVLPPDIMKRVQRLENKGRAIIAISLSGRRRPIIENMSVMAPTYGAMILDAGPK